MWLDVKQAGYHTKFGITEKDCKGFGKRLDKSISNVCPGPLDTMAWLQQLASYAIGFNVWEDAEGNDISELHRDLRKRKKILNSNFILGSNGEPVEDENGVWLRKETTEEELQELREIAIELNTHISVLKKGKGAKYLEWTTPSGFPVRSENWYSYADTVWGRIETYPPAPDGKSCKNGINHVIRVDTDVPMKSDFSTGISPNFVHSQDAAHQALTCVHFDGEFLGIHDSFGTHASDVDDLLASTKFTFEEMYEIKDTLQSLMIELLQPDIPTEEALAKSREDIKVFLEEQPMPKMGKLNLSDVHNSDHFFS